MPPPPHHPKSPHLPPPPTDPPDRPPPPSPLPEPPPPMPRPPQGPFANFYWGGESRLKARGRPPRGWGGSRRPEPRGCPPPPPVFSVFHTSKMGKNSGCTHMLWVPKMVPFCCFAPLSCVSLLLRIHPGKEQPLHYAWLCSTEARLCARHVFFSKNDRGHYGPPQDAAAATPPPLCMKCEDDTHHALDRNRRTASVPKKGEVYVCAPSPAASAPPRRKTGAPHTGCRPPFSARPTSQCRGDRGGCQRPPHPTAVTIPGHRVPPDFRWCARRAAGGRLHEATPRGRADGGDPMIAGSAGEGKGVCRTGFTLGGEETVRLLGQLRSSRGLVCPGVVTGVR